MGAHCTKRMMVASLQSIRRVSRCRSHSMLKRQQDYAEVVFKGLCQLTSWNSKDTTVRNIVNRKLS